MTAPLEAVVESAEQQYFEAVKRRFTFSMFLRTGAGVSLLIVALRVSVPAPPSSTSKDSRVSFADASLA